MAIIGLLLLIFGVIVTSNTELLEDLLEFDGFFMSPSRIYMVLVTLCVAVFSIPAMLNSGRVTIGKYFKRTLLIAGLLLFVGLLSTMFADDRVYTIKRLVNYVLLLCAPFIAYLLLSTTQGSPSMERTRINAYRALRVVSLIFIVTGVGVAMFGLIQEFTGLLITKAEGRSVLGVTYIRINALFADGNFFAYFMLIPLWLAFGYRFAKDRVINFCLRYGIIGLFVLNILLTGSRGAVIALVVSYLYMLLEKVISHKKVFWVACVGFVCTVAIIFLSVFLNFENIVGTVQGVDEDGNSAISRLMVWYAGINMFIDHPVLGVGPGNFVTQGKGTYLGKVGVPAYQFEQISTLAGHSNYLEFLSEFGLAGLVLYLLLSFYPLSGISATVAHYYNDGKFVRYLQSYKYALISCLFANLFLSYYPYFLAIAVGLQLYIADVFSVRLQARQASHAETCERGLSCYRIHEEARG